MAWIRWRRAKDGRRLATLVWREGGKERYRALGTSDPVLAKMALQAHVGGTLDPTHSGTPQEAIQALVAALRREATAGTADYYRTRLRALCGFLGASGWAGWTPRRFAELAAARGWSPRTIQMARTAGRKLISWGRAHGYPVPDFLGSFRGPTVRQEEPESLDRDELARLLDAARGRTIEPAVVLAALAGFRRNDVLAGEWKDVRWSRREVVCRGTKRHKARTIPASDALLEALTRHRRPSGPILARHRSPRNANRALHAVCRAAGLEPFGFHRLRHTFASRLVEEGADVPTVQRLLGHARPEQTLRYLHTDPERMRRAVSRII